MSEPLFNIVTFGMTQSGVDRNQVAEDMARLFKTTPEKLKPYFAGGRKVIKSNVDELVAEKYRVTLEKIGLVITIEEAAEAEAPAPKGASQQTAGAQQEETADTNGISIAEVGADVLKEDERPVVEPAPIGDITDISMAEVGSDVLKEDERPVVEPAPIGDISDITVAEVGTDVLREDERPVVESPPIGDISDISVAEIGADVLREDEHVTVEPVPIDDISDISMAEVGADVIENPKPKPKVEIDTSDIELAN